MICLSINCLNVNTNTNVCFQISNHLFNFDRLPIVKMCVKCMYPIFVL